MFLNRATRALPEYSQQHERERTNMGESRRYTKLKWEKNTEMHCKEPIIEIPPTPPYEDPAPQSNEEFEQEFHDDNIEDIGYDAVITPAHEKEIIPIQPRATPTPMIKRYHL